MNSRTDSISVISVISVVKSFSKFSCSTNFILISSSSLTSFSTWVFRLTSTTNFSENSLMCSSLGVSYSRSCSSSSRAFTSSWRLETSRADSWLTSSSSCSLLCRVSSLSLLFEVSVTGIWLILLQCGCGWEVEGGWESPTEWAKRSELTLPKVSHY